MVPFQHVRTPSEAVVRLSTAAHTKKNNKEMNAIKMRTLKPTKQNTPLGN